MLLIFRTVQDSSASSSSSTSTSSDFDAEVVKAKSLLAASDYRVTELGTNRFFSDKESVDIFRETVNNGLTLNNVIAVLKRDKEPPPGTVPGWSAEFTLFLLEVIGKRIDPSIYVIGILLQ